MRNLYQEVTDQIVAELEAGATPWVKPWSGTPGLNVPCNAITGRAYSGVNVLLLWLARERGWPTPRFLTFYAGYIASWITLLKHDNKAIFTCASKAQAAIDYLRDLALAEPAQAAE